MSQNEWLAPCGDPEYCIVFICQSGELEIRSLFLAASLRRFLRGSYELVAALPTPFDHWGELREETRLLLDKLQVRCQEIVNPISTAYPMLNKLSAIGVETKAPVTIYLDADILCVRNLDLQAEFTHDFMVKPADCQSYSMEPIVWEKIYRNFNLALPRRRVLSTVDHKLMFPYFNSGVVCVRDGPRFSKEWIFACEALLADDSICNKDYWVCQLALPPAAEKSGYEFTCLNEALNYPVNLKTINPEDMPILCHYKNNERLRSEPILVMLLQSILDEFPEIKNLLSDKGGWGKLLNRNLVAHNKKQDFIVTGIPRSGTSLLCSMLHEVKNCIVVNEPTAIFESLIHEAEPVGLPRVYGDLRRNVLEGNPVENKIKNGEMIQDTFITDERCEYTPKIDNEAFLLGTKNTIAYLSRLRQIDRVMPHASIIVCVRNPYDCIASWMTTFSILKNVEISAFPVGGASDRFVSQEARARLTQIEQEENLQIKRALLWRHFAINILDNIDRVTLIKYENLIAHPEKTIGKILRSVMGDAYMNTPTYKQNFEVRSKKDKLRKLDVQAINDLCALEMKALGYTILEIS